MSSVDFVDAGDFYPRGAALRDLLRTMGTHLAVEEVNSPVLEPRLWWIPCRKWVCETMAVEAWDSDAAAVLLIHFASMEGCRNIAAGGTAMPREVWKLDADS